MIGETKAMRLERYSDECADRFLASGKPYACRAVVLDVIEGMAARLTANDTISYRTVINRAIAKIDEHR